MKIFFILSFNLLFSFAGYTQNVKVTFLTDSIIAEIDSSNVYEISYTVGYAGRISQQYTRMLKLTDSASQNELEYLALNHKNAVVRLYALKALKRKAVSLTDAIISFFLNDKSKVTVLNGCNGGYKTVNSIAKDIITNKTYFW